MSETAGSRSSPRVNPPKDQQRADQIFAEAMDRPPAARHDFIESVCGEDDTLRSEVQELLEHYSSAEDALTQTRTTHRITGRPEIEQVDLRTDSGRTVGTCRLDGKLPDDGLFEQWATRRNSEGPPAILSLARSRLSLDEARRVGVHAESLLRLDHPGLPRVIEAGTVDLGRGPEAFFLVEHIEGAPLPEGAASSISDLGRRVEYLVDVCDAVQELHFSGLLHARISADRCVVTEDDRVRLIGPGLLAAVARAVPESVAAIELREADGAPERPILAALALDGRVDVFDLGTIIRTWLADMVGPLADQLRIISTKATSHDRQDRYRSAGELGDAIRFALSPHAHNGDDGMTLTDGLSPILKIALLTLSAVVGFTVGVLLF